MRNRLGSQAGEATREADRLSVSRIRHIIEDRWGAAGMVNYGMSLGRRWVWLTRRGLQTAQLPFRSRRPAEAGLDHLHHVNRIRLTLERLSGSANPSGRWERACWYQHNQQEWRVRQKTEPRISIPDVYRVWHTPAGIWTFREEGALVDSSVIVEVCAKRPWAFDSMHGELARCKSSVWYFVEMDPKQEVFSVLKHLIEKLDDQDKSRFSFYDLAEPGRLVYDFE